MPDRTPPEAETEPEPYHHGNLRDAVLDAVGEILAEKGIGGLSLREAARRAGVSHAAPAHHFGDKLGMLTAFSTRGYERFEARLRWAAEQPGSPSERLIAVGVEYVRFAVEERAYFDVMFRDDMHDPDDQHFQAVSQSAFSVLMDRAADLARLRPGQEAAMIAIRGWSMAHGLAGLWIDGALRLTMEEDDVYELAARMFAGEFD